MVYKKGPPYRVRPIRDIEEDLETAEKNFGHLVENIFFPAGNTIAMPAGDLAHICSYSRILFPELGRITVYGSSRYIHEKGPEELLML